VEIEDALRALGGTARWRDLRGHVGWRAMRRAQSADTVVHEAGVWSLVTTDRAQVLAAQLRAVRSHSTAAEHWGFALPPSPDDEFELTVPASAHRPATAGVRLRYRQLDPSEVVGDVTTPVRTVVDCLREGTLRVALSVGDSGLRSRLVDHAALTRAVRSLRGPGSRQARARLPLLDARAANAFESCCRALLLEEGITGFQPQVTIRHRGHWLGRVDLADRSRRIVIECDGYETHGGRRAFVSDLIRFTSLVAAGWRPLRFTWEQVMFQPEWVLEKVRDTRDGAQSEEQSGRGRRKAAA
jgi:very-short-patch-repair endonuclease